MNKINKRTVLVNLILSIICANFNNNIFAGQVMSIFSRETKNQESNQTTLETPSGLPRKIGEMTCYFNTLFQILHMDDNFREYIAQKASTNELFGLIDEIFLYMDANIIVPEDKYHLLVEFIIPDINSQEDPEQAVKYIKDVFADDVPTPEMIPLDPLDGFGEGVKIIENTPPDKNCKSCLYNWDRSNAEPKNYDMNLPIEVVNKSGQTMKLTAIVVFEGESGTSGHFCLLKFRDNFWWKCNDSKVEKLDKNSMNWDKIGTEACMAYYQII